jgi:WhiB family redox-sensing transcriptional regulator
MADTRRLPAPLDENWNWQEMGACRSANVELFFHPEFERGPNRARRVAQAKALCLRCPVIDQCREHALTVQEAYGTWGGLDEMERRQILSRHEAG